MNLIYTWFLIFLLFLSFLFNTDSVLYDDDARVCLCLLEKKEKYSTERRKVGSLADINSWNDGHMCGVAALLYVPGDVCIAVGMNEWMSEWLTNEVSICLRKDIILCLKNIYIYNLI